MRTCKICRKDVRPGVNYAYLHWLLCSFTDLWCKSGDSEGLKYIIPQSCGCE